MLDEPGHPDEWTPVLKKWLEQSRDPLGTLQPEGIDPDEWAVRQFIQSWTGSVRPLLDSLESGIQQASRLCDAGSNQEAAQELDDLRQLLQDLRDELGVHDWNG